MKHLFTGTFNIIKLEVKTGELTMENLLFLIFIGILIGIIICASILVPIIIQLTKRIGRSKHKRENSDSMKPRDTADELENKLENADVQMDKLKKEISEVMQDYTGLMHISAYNMHTDTDTEIDQDFYTLFNEFSQLIKVAQKKVDEYSYAKDIDRLPIIIEELKETLRSIRMLNDKMLLFNIKK